MADKLTVRNLGELGPHLQDIVNRLTANQNLLRYLYYTDKDPLNSNKKNLSAEDVFNSHIKIIPVINIPEKDYSILSIVVAKGSPVNQNNEFIDLYLTIEIFVPITQWILKSDSLRPFLIIGEISNSLNDKVVSGLGKLKLLEFSANFFTEEVGSYNMYFHITQYN